MSKESTSKTNGEQASKESVKKSSSNEKYQLPDLCSACPYSRYDIPESYSNCLPFSCSPKSNLCSGFERKYTPKGDLASLCEPNCLPPSTISKYEQLLFDLQFPNTSKIMSKYPSPPQSLRKCLPTSCPPSPAYNALRRAYCLSSDLSPRCSVTCLPEPVRCPRPTSCLESPPCSPKPSKCAPNLPGFTKPSTAQCEPCQPQCISFCPPQCSPQCSPQCPPQCPPQCLPQCQPQCSPQCLPQCQPQCFPQWPQQCPPQWPSQCPPQCVPQCPPQCVPQCPPQCVPQCPPQCVPQCPPQCLPQCPLPCVPQCPPQCIPQCPPQCPIPCPPVQCPPQCSQPYCPPQCPPGSQPVVCTPQSSSSNATLCCTEAECQRPKGLFEYYSGVGTWDTYGVRIKWTDPVAPGSATVWRDYSVLLKMCVEVKQSSGIKPELIMANCWTNMKTLCNPCGTWKDIPMLYQCDSSCEGEYGICRYVYSISLTPTVDDAYKLTFNITWRDILIWANGVVADSS